MSTFVDKITISVIGGHGGPGCSSFRREKYTPKGGPDGGDGGQGGDVILRVSKNIQTLLDLKLKTTYKAMAGQPGRTKKQFGSNGKSTIIEVPKGTMIFDEDGEKIVDLCDDSHEFIAARGGKGGKGNTHFSTSKNRAPTYAQPGLPGASRTITLELRLISEVGLVGLPNAGKSTLLKTLTNANPKIAAYPFTTLFPNLGVIKKFDRETVIADIPGIIEGASQGEGLGDEFLRHIDRTKVLVHLVSVESADIDTILGNYKTIIDELGQSEYQLNKKPNLLVLSKVELIEKELLADLTQKFKDMKLKTLAISSLNRINLDQLINEIYKKIDDNAEKMILDGNDE